ncbi:MAG: hypothetical protein HOI21_14745 [Bacteroidetes Order II. Incertae sedis bacterium]|nr:hypothetical protein [Bacteroidetes Order II. bacterium]
MSVELKVKAKSLAAEAVIIKHEEHKAKKAARYWRGIEGESANSYGSNRQRAASNLASLTYHRKTVVRWEARATHLARAYIQGRPYKSVEAKCKDWGTLNIYIRPRILAMVKKYGKNRWHVNAEKENQARTSIQEWLAKK